MGVNTSRSEINPMRIGGRLFVDVMSTRTTALQLGKEGLLQLRGGTRD